MPRYLLSVHMADGEAREAMTDEQMQHSWQEIQALETDMKSTSIGISDEMARIRSDRKTKLPLSIPTKRISRPA